MKLAGFANNTIACVIVTMLSSLAVTAAPVYYSRSDHDIGISVAENEAFCSGQGLALCCYNELCPNDATSISKFEAHSVILLACCPSSGQASCGGDPHFTRWSGARFNHYQGECDLVLAHSKSFQLRKRCLHVHVRTKIESVYSIITAVAIQSGESVFEFNNEVVEDPKYFVNKESLSALPYDGGDFSVSSRTVHNQDLNVNVQIITVDLGQKSKIQIDVMDQWVFVNIDAAGKDVADSVGLAGSYTTGKWLARDQQTDLTHDRNEFGSEWQVQPDLDPQLFHSTPEGHPVAPYASCKLPAEDGHQFLRGKSPAMYKLAQEVCKKEGVSAEDMDDSVFDVTVLENPKIAAAWWGKELNNHVLEDKKAESL